MTGFLASQLNYYPFSSEWSEWRASAKCNCKGNSTEGVRSEYRNCTPSPMPEFKDTKCAINGKYLTIITMKVQSRV